MNFERNPQKRLVKKICSLLYCLGVGNCWYETRPTTELYQSLYKIWMVISNFYTFSFMSNEFLAYIRTDLTDEDRNDLVQFSLAHSIISGKIIFLYIEKKRIIYVLSRLLESDDLFFTGKLDRACVKKSVRLCAAVLIVSYMALLTTTFDGVRAHLADGVPIRTEVTYYPPTTASGLATNTLRLFIQLHWWFAVTIMLGIDTLCISSLVIVGYKFKILQVYFANLRKKVFSNRNKTRDALEEEFKNDFIAGIKMHGHALWCAKNMQGALGNLYSVQVFESVVLIVMCLIKIVSTERNLTFLVANMSYIGCLILLTGSYMLPAGDITHEAVSMLNRQVYYGQTLRVIMIRGPTNSILLPKALSAVGPGLGSNGRPLRTIIEHYQKFTNKETASLNREAFDIQSSDDGLIDDEKYQVKTHDVFNDILKEIETKKTKEAEKNAGKEKIVEVKNITVVKPASPAPKHVQQRPKIHNSPGNITLELDALNSTFLRKI